MGVLKTLKPGGLQVFSYPYIEDISPYMERNDDIGVVCPIIIITSAKLAPVEIPLIFCMFHCNA